MLRGIFVRELDGVVDVVDEDAATAVLECLPRDLAALHRSELALDLPGHLLREPVRGREEDRTGEGVVLGLSEQIGGDQLGGGALVGDDDRLRGPVDGIDPHVAENEPLGDGDEQPARPAYLVHPRDGFGAVGERSDALSAARLEHGIHAGDVGGDELHRRHAPVREDRAREVHLIDPGHPRGDCAHQHGAGQGRLRARDVDPDPLEWARELAETVLVEVEEGPAELELVVLANPGRCKAQRLHDLAIDCIVGRADLLGGDPQLFGVRVVELQVVEADRVVAVFAHVTDDATNHLLRRELLAEGPERRLPDIHRQLFDLEGAPREDGSAAFFGVADYAHPRYLASTDRAASVDRSR